MKLGAFLWLKCILGNLGDIALLPPPAHVRAIQRMNCKINVVVNVVETLLRLQTE